MVAGVEEGAGAGARVGDGLLSSIMARFVRSGFEVQKSQSIRSSILRLSCSCCTELHPSGCCVGSTRERHRRRRHRRAPPATPPGAGHGAALRTPTGRGWKPLRERNRRGQRRSSSPGARAGTSADVVHREASSTGGGFRSQPRSFRTTTHVGEPATIGWNELNEKLVPFTPSV